MCPAETERVSERSARCARLSAHTHTPHHTLCVVAVYTICILFRAETVNRVGFRSRDQTRVARQLHIWTNSCVHTLCRRV